MGVKTMAHCCRKLLNVKNPRQQRKSRQNNSYWRFTTNYERGNKIKSEENEKPKISVEAWKYIGEPANRSITGFCRLLERKKTHISC